MSEKKTVGVIFGGRSVEHEVSILTGLQIINALDREIYEPIPIYVSKAGEWFTGASLLDISVYRNFDPYLSGAKPAAIVPDRSIHGLITPIVSGWLKRTRVIKLDVVFPAIHGTHGEDGTLQGLLELADIPYVGCGVPASAIGMNKALTKELLRVHGLPILDYLVFERNEWQREPNKVLSRVSEHGFSYPLFVKPCSLGSSIGITSAQTDMQLREALDVAFNYDSKAIVEKSAGNQTIEVNCAVVGSENDLLVSACEQPVQWQEYLSYEDKYLRGDVAQGMKGAKRNIPAPISESLTKRIQECAKSAFQAIGARGLARVDFFVNEYTGEIFVNELNTVPGSVSFYLWKPVGIEPKQLIDKLITIAMSSHAEKQQMIFSYDVGLLEKVIASGGGTKFGKLAPTSQPLDAEL